MRKMFWIGILGIVTTTGNATAQVSSECSGISVGEGSCRFACQAGDFIAVSGFRYDSEYGEVNVNAFCGSAAEGCSGIWSCTAQSESAVAYDDENGSCLAGAWVQCGYERCPDLVEYRCASVTPKEAAELKTSGQALVIQIPEQ